MGSQKNRNSQITMTSKETFQGELDFEDRKTPALTDSQPPAQTPKSAEDTAAAENTSAPATQTNITQSVKVSLPQEWPYRMLGNALILGIIFFLASITITFKNDLINKRLMDLQDSFYELSSKLGFTIDDIIVRGHKRTSIQDIANIITNTRQDNILEQDLDEIRYKIEQLPWVKNALVKRSFFPNVIQIEIEEHDVKSLWQLNEKFHPIDENGQVIEAPFTPTKPILLIVGLGAPEHINELLSIIDDGSEIFKRVKAANYISERRWDIILDHIEGGITIKLPEKGVKEAWEKLKKLNESKNILKRKLTKIDLRLKGKVIITIEKTQKKKLSRTKERKI